jgi:hypothetical protein
MTVLTVVEAMLLIFSTLKKVSFRRKNSRGYLQLLFPAASNTFPIVSTKIFMKNVICLCIAMQTERSLFFSVIGHFCHLYIMIPLHSYKALLF